MNTYLLVSDSCNVQSAGIYLLPNTYGYYLEMPGQGSVQNFGLAADDDLVSFLDMAATDHFAISKHLRQQLSVIKVKCLTSRLP